MDVLAISLLGIIMLLLIERAWDKTRNLRIQDMLNRALIAKTVPEYEATAASEIKKLKLENDNALAAADALYKYAKEQDERIIPITS